MYLGPGKKLESLLRNYAIIFLFGGGGFNPYKIVPTFYTLQIYVANRRRAF